MCWKVKSKFKMPKKCFGKKTQTNQTTTTKNTLTAVLQGKVPPEGDLPLDTSPG